MKLYNPQPIMELTQEEQQTMNKRKKFLALGAIPAFIAFFWLFLSEDPFNFAPVWIGIGISIITTILINKSLPEPPYKKKLQSLSSIFKNIRYRSGGTSRGRHATSGTHPRIEGTYYGKKFLITGDITLGRGFVLHIPANKQHFEQPITIEGRTYKPSWIFGRIGVFGKGPDKDIPIIFEELYRRSQQARL